MTQQLRRRARSRRAFRNDEILLDAATQVIAQKGWDNVAFTQVAGAAELTTRPIYDRFGDKTGLGQGVWEHRVSPELKPRLRALLEAATAPEPTGRLAVFESSATWFANPDTTMAAGIELLASAPVDDALRDLIVDDLSEVLALATPGEGRSASEAARSAYALAFALGLLMSHRRPSAGFLDLAPVARKVAQALGAPVRHRAYPELGKRSLVQPLENFHTGDEALDALLGATILEVASRGYGAATTSRIVATAGMTEGLLYGRYKTKLDVFLDATERRHHQAMKANLGVAEQIAEEHGQGMASALQWREWTRPEHRLLQALNSESVRLSWREPRLAQRTDSAEETLTLDLLAAIPEDQHLEARADIHWRIAMGHGTILLPTFLPEVWKLPMDVVMVPLFDEQH